jgi:hypothetical protein
MKESVQLMKLARALVLVGVGVLGLLVVYSMRPPAGFIDALGMMSQGRSHFVREPLYQILLGCSGLVTLIGSVGVARHIPAVKRLIRSEGGERA